MTSFLVDFTFSSFFVCASFLLIVIHLQQQEKLKFVNLLGNFGASQNVIFWKRLLFDDYSKDLLVETIFFKKIDNLLKANGKIRTPKSYRLKKKKK